jgi:hypothetical protein
MMSSLDRLCRNRGVKITSTFGGAEVPEGWTPGTHGYKCVLRYQGRQATVPFFMGPAHCKEPTAADVLHCLCSDTRSVDNARSFTDWCADFGYDSDSRKAEATYSSCIKLGTKVKRLLGADFELFADAEH